VWAWGANQNGQLGRKTVTGHEARPARVAVLNHVTKIAAGADFALALRSDGIVFAWGHGQSGQLRQRRHGRQPGPGQDRGPGPGDRDRGGSDASLATENNGISALTSVWAWGAKPGRGTRRRHAGRPRHPPSASPGSRPYIAGVTAGAGIAAVLAPTARLGLGRERIGQLASRRRAP